MKAEILKKYQCPRCDQIHKDELDAIDCCPKQAITVFICSICKAINWTEDFAWDHIDNMHPTSAAEIDGYLKSLRFGTPPIGEWVTTMQAETEFLIPVE